jgi:hypothetical protein
MRRLYHNGDDSEDTAVNLTEMELERLGMHTPTSSESSCTSVDDEPNPDPAAEPIPWRSLDFERSRPLVVKDYCLQAIKEGHTKCIWLCMRHGKKWIAKDVKAGARDSPLSVYELRKMCGWWKRHSLYSAVGVKGVMVCSQLNLVNVILLED